LEFGFYNMDCIEGMKQFSDKYFDLAIVDPPYGIGVGSMAYTNGVQIVGNALAKRRDYSGHKEWDSKPPTQEYFNELFRVSKQQVIWGGTTLPINYHQQRVGLCGISGVQKSIPMTLLIVS
jgi:site-specific DNA-methyltransferase (adenine-specific)